MRGFGLSVRAGDPVRLLEAIGTILSDDDRRMGMVAAGRRTLRETFDVNVAVTSMLAQIAQAQGEKSAAGGAFGARPGAAGKVDR